MTLVFLKGRDEVETPFTQNQITCQLLIIELKWQLPTKIPHHSVMSSTRWFASFPHPMNSDEQVDYFTELEEASLIRKKLDRGVYRDIIILLLEIHAEFLK